jgi:hypothetical protein
MKDKNKALMFMFVLVLAVSLYANFVSAYICSDTNQVNNNELPCEGLTPKNMSCSSNAEIIYLDNTLENYSVPMSLKYSPSIYNFTFNVTNLGNYLITLCDNSTAILTVYNATNSSSNIWSYITSREPSWLSTFNLTYDMFAYNQSNATFNQYGKFWYNQTTASIDWVLNRSYLTNETDPLWTSNSTINVTDCPSGFSAYGIYISNWTLKCQETSSESNSDSTSTTRQNYFIIGGEKIDYTWVWVFGGVMLFTFLVVVVIVIDLYMRKNRL